MAMINSACPECTADNCIPARAMLATLDLGGFREPVGWLSWSCLSCSHLVTAELDVENLLRLLAAGVPLLDDDFGRSAVAEEHTDSGSPARLDAEQHGQDAPFTLQDVLALHELLETETWVQQLAERPDGCS